jgi:hypothetical protein
VITMLNISLLLLVLALLVTVAAGIGRAPLWPAVLLGLIANLVELVGPR